MIEAIGITAAKGVKELSTTSNAPQHSTNIFRSGNGGNANLTPRPVIDSNGLSYFRKAGDWKNVTMTTVEAVNATKVLKAIPDPKNPDHYLIMATDPIEHQIWMASREKVLNGADPYYLTQLSQLNFPNKALI